MGSMGRYPKKCPKLCWPIRSKETWTKYTPLTLLNHRKLALINREICTFIVLKSLQHLTNLTKNYPFPYLGLEITRHVIKNQIHLVRQSLQHCSVFMRAIENVSVLLISILSAFLLYSFFSPLSTFANRFHNTWKNLLKFSKILHYDP